MSAARCAHFSGLKSIAADLDLSSFEEIKRVFIDAVADTKNDPGDARVDQGFGAVDTRKMSHITGCPPGGYTVKRSLNDGIRLSMDCPDAVLLHHQVTNIVAVLLPGRGTVKSCGQDAFI